MKSNFENVQKLYDDLRSVWESKLPDWREIANFVGISVDVDYINRRGVDSDTSKRDLDVFVDDPTSAISVNQAGDYLLGVMWGTGESVVDVVPSRYVTELVDEANVAEFYDFVTDQALYHMNH